MVWYSHLFENFPQFVVIHTVKGFSIVNREQIDVFLELPCFLCRDTDRPWQVDSLLLTPSGKLDKGNVYTLLCVFLFFTMQVQIVSV